MDTLRGLRLLRDDPEWLMKLLVGTVLLLTANFIPLLGQVVLMGWAALITRRVAAGSEGLPPLTFDLDYLSKLLGPGFKGFIVGFVWGLPLVFLVMGFFGCFGFAMVTGAATASEAGDAGPLVMVCMTSVMVVVMPVLIALGSLPAAMAMVRAEVADDISAGLDFGAVFHMTRTVFRELFVGTLVLMLVAMGMTLLGMLMGCVGVLPAQVAIFAARAHFGGQLYRLYVERGGTPVRIGPVDLAPAAAATL